MVKWRLSTPDDEMYREGPRSYNPHWTRSVAKPAPTKVPEPEPPKNDGAPVKRETERTMRPRCDQTLTPTVC
jgi:hypothetical protein